MDFDDKGAEPQEDYPADPFASKPRNAYSSFTHAVLATALFRCWQVVVKSSSPLRTDYSLQAYLAILWHMGDRRVFD